MSTKISGSKYAAMYGPTTGDKVRLADTSLVIEVEKDYTTYGDEVKFGGGKTIRDGMGQSVKTCSKDGDLDLVITNALIVDSTGIVKADIGIKDGKISLSMKALEEPEEEGDQHLKRYQQKAGENQIPIPVHQRKRGEVALHRTVFL